MLMPVAPSLEGRSTAVAPLPAEIDFYSAYDWCLDPHLTLRDAIGHLRGELEKFDVVPQGWQTVEVATNVYLLSCALLNGVDEYLRGPVLRMPKQLAATLPGRSARWMTRKFTESLRRRSRTPVRRWRDRWHADLIDMLAVFARGASDPKAFVDSRDRLADLLHAPLPSDLHGTRLGIPSPFRRLDLTHVDVVTLGRRFMERFADRSRPIVILGLRTSGTYFAALLHAVLRSEGYDDVRSLTVHPKKGAGSRELNELRSYAARGYSIAIVDDPPHTGNSISLALDIARRSGFDLGKVTVLVPTHPARPSWSKSLPAHLVISLDPEQWHKKRLLDPEIVQRRLSEYCGGHGFAELRLIDSPRVAEFNARLQDSADRKRGSMLKQVYEMRLHTGRGQGETRYVLAKGVGVGWLGYHAFLAGHRLSGFVPPIFGLRDGILYMEWLPPTSTAEGGHCDRDAWIETAASYVAARVRSLALPKGRVPGKAVYENGFRLLAEVLSRSYGRFVANSLMQARVEQRLSKQTLPFPTLIDGNMHGAEWISAADGPLKTDYEHHGFGKTELNGIDPAYDLADFILSLELTSDEERRLIERYVAESGDVNVNHRLFMNKLLAGLWTMSSVQENLFGVQQSAEEQRGLHRRFMGAWNFLTVQTARFCGTHCRLSQASPWRSPFVALDIDGVLDHRLFGYPCTTAAGIGALRLLSTGGFSVGVNTARSVAEVREYCEAYGLAGGVAENGTYLWDAMAGRGRVLVGAEALRQLEQLRRALQQIPGIFLDDRHQYSIRAITYERESSSLLRFMKSVRSFSVGDGAPGPISSLLMNHLMTDLRLDRLSFHHTTIDTTVIAKETNKGVGLLALRDWVLGPDAETIAVGDSEADLSMFRVATHSFAPAQIGCARQARLLGCRISRQRYQRGLLDIARLLVRARSLQDRHEADDPMFGADRDSFFLELLQAADRPQAKSLVAAVFDPATWRHLVH
jgi:hydroxymethylpyrimidine pyrophosphatase-like HAD family hydrolase